MKQVEYRTGEEDSGQRIDAVLAKKFSEFSRTSWQQSLMQKPARVDDQIVGSNYKLKPNQTITAYLPVQKQTKITLIPPKVLPDIIYQDSDVIIINKPAGLITHPTDTLPTEPSVAGAFAENIMDDDPMRPGIVHRLDKDTSGVMVLARNLAAKKLLQEQFRNRKVIKHYIALVQGRLSRPAARIELPLQKSQRQPNTMVVHFGGKMAITQYQVTAQYPHASLIDVTIHTGRTHQIRAHFAHLGHPVVGDTKYGKQTLPKGLSRQFLHASSLSLLLPSGKKQTFTAELPLELKSYLEQL